jgi:hypothetical protein
MTTLPQASLMRLPRPPGGSSLAIPYNGAQPMAAPPSTSQLTFGDVMRVLRANAWLIIIMLILSIAGGYGANTWLAKYHSRYTATGWIEVSAPTRVSPVTQTYSGEDLGALAIEQRTTAQLLKTPSLFSELLKRQDIRDTSWFQQFEPNGPEGQVGAAAADLNENVVITPLADTKLITVSMSYKDPVAAWTIAKALVDEHIIEQNEANNTDLANRSMVLQQARDRYMSQKVSISADVREKAAKLNINSDGSSARMTAADTEMANLTRVQTELGITLNNAKEQLEYLTGQINDGVDPIEITEAAERDPEVQIDQQNLKALQLGEMEAIGANNEQYKNIQSRITQVQKMYDDDLARAKNEARAAMLSDLKNQILQVNRNLDSLAQNIKDHVAEQQELSATMTDYLVAKEEEAGYMELIKDAKGQLDEITDLAMIKKNKIEKTKKRR